MIKVRKFVFNPFFENTYIVWDDYSYEGMIIDAGCSNDNENEMLNNFILSEKILIKYLVSTHCHIDHILGNKFILQKFAPVYLAPEKDLPLLQNLKQQGTMFGIEADDSPIPDKFINTAESIFLGETSFTFIETPGHTPGGFCIHNNKNKIIFSGDVLFLESIGRTDLWGGNSSQLFDSIKNKLFTLDINTKVYPGHGEETTIGYEIKNNEFIS